jgi:hypothetical protein
VELGDDVVAILLRAPALPFEHFPNGHDLLCVGDRRFFEGQGVACGALVVAHRSLASAPGPEYLWSV